MCGVALMEMNRREKKGTIVSFPDSGGLTDLVFLPESGSILAGFVPWSAGSDPPWVASRRKKPTVCARRGSQRMKNWGLRAAPVS